MLIGSFAVLLPLFWEGTNHQSRLCIHSGKAVVYVRQELPVAAGGIGGPALGALQETLIQEVGDFGRRRRSGRVADGQVIKLKIVVGAGLRETGAWRFLKHKT